MPKLTVDIAIDVLTLLAGADCDDSRILTKQLLQVNEEQKDHAKQNGFDDESSLFVGIIQDLIDTDSSLNREPEINRILLKVRSSKLLKGDPEIYTRLEALLLNKEVLGVQRKISLIDQITQWIIFTKIELHTKHLFGKQRKYNFKDTATNDSLINDMIEHAKYISSIRDDFGNRAKALNWVSTRDPNSMRQAIREGHQKAEVRKLKLGLKGLNDMMGGGAELGRTYIFGALSHNYKTQLLTNISRWICRYNHVEVEVGKTPAVLLLSFENEVKSSTKAILKSIYTNSYHQLPPEDMSEDEMMELIQGYLGVNGIAWECARFKDGFSFADFERVMADMKSKGYRVIAVCMDYLTLLEPDIPVGGSADMSRALIRNAHKLTQYAHAEDIAIFSGIQLGDKAQMIVDNKVAYTVRKFGRSTVGLSKNYIQEFDFFAFMHIEQVEDTGVYYLTFKWDKDRDKDRPAEEVLYPAYRFHPELGILDDLLPIDGKSQAIYDIYADFPPDLKKQDAKEESNTLESLF